MSDKRCCVPECTVTRDDKITLHSFPNPEKDPERFRSWLYNIGGDILALDNNFIYKQRKVCHKHFEVKFHTRSCYLSPDAVPTLQLSGFRKKATKRPLSDVTNKISAAEATPQPGPSESPKPRDSLDVKERREEALPSSKVQTQKKKKLSLKQEEKQKEISVLKSKIKTLMQKKESYATRLKKALKLSENETFQKLMKKFTTLAAMFTVMQFREIGKDKLGRRFTRDEKIMALSLYKQGPRAYRWLSKVFVLPSPLTLRRLLAKVGIKPLQLQKGLDKWICLKRV